MALLTTTKRKPDLASQIDFGALDGQLSFYIRLIETLVSRHLDAHLRDLEYCRRKGTISTMVVIARHPGVRATSIAARLHMDKSIIVKIVDDLIGHGLIVRKTAPEDRRAFELHPTDKGRKVATQMEEMVICHSGDFFAQIMSREEHDLVVDILRRALEKLES